MLGSQFLEFFKQNIGRIKRKQKKDTKFCRKQADLKKAEIEKHWKRELQRIKIKKERAKNSGWKQ